MCTQRYNLAQLVIVVLIWTYAILAERLFRCLYQRGLDNRGSAVYYHFYATEWIYDLIHKNCCYMHPHCYIAVFVIATFSWEYMQHFYCILKYFLPMLGFLFNPLANHYHIDAEDNGQNHSASPPTTQQVHSITYLDT